MGLPRYHDVIIGRDILEFLRMDVKFSDQTVEWEFTKMPCKDQDSDLMDFFAEEPAVVEEVNERLRKILDTKHEKADFDKICHDQPELSKSEQDHFLCLLAKCESLFDGASGTWNGTKVNLELNEDVIPRHACHTETLTMEVHRLCELGVLK